MTTKQVNYTLYQGEGRVLQFDAGVDISNIELDFRVFTRGDDNVFSYDETDGIEVTNEVSGLFEVTLKSSDTANLTPQKTYWFHLRAIDADAQEKVLVHAQLFIKDSPHH